MEHALPDTLAISWPAGDPLPPPATEQALQRAAGVLAAGGLVAIPTEPLLAASRRLIQPIGGVDVTPVIWVGLISLVRELLVGQQGVLSLIALRAQGLVAAAG